MSLFGHRYSDGQAKLSGEKEVLADLKEGRKEGGREGRGE